MPGGTVALALDAVLALTATAAVATWAAAPGRGRGGRGLAALVGISAALQLTNLLAGGGRAGWWRSPLHLAAAVALGLALWWLAHGAKAPARRDRLSLERALAVVSAGLVAVIVASPARPGALARLAPWGWVSFATDVGLLAVALVALMTTSRVPRAGAPVAVGQLPVSLAAAVLAVRNLATLVPDTSGLLVPGSTEVRLVAAAGLGLLAVAGLVRLTRRPGQPVAGVTGAIAACAPGFVCVVVVDAYAAVGTRVPTGMIVAAIGLGALLFLRLGTALQDNRALAASLESQIEERTLALLTRERWFSSLVANSSDALTVVRRDGSVLYCSPAFSRLFGHDAEAMVGMSLTPLLQPEQAANLLHQLASVTGRANPAPVLELDVWHRAGHWCHTETAVSCLLDDPIVHGIVLNIRDISDRRRLQERLAHEASHDTLTGLANRALLQARLAEAAADAAPDTVAVLFCDLDGFKAVNDSRGHETGDRLLQAVAGRLLGCVRAGDVVARFGGDEFAILLRGPAAGARATELAHRLVASLSQPYQVEDSELRIGVSVGISVAGAGARSAEELLRNADLAMYRSKTSRGTSVTMFAPAMHDALLAQLEVEDDLREALGRGQLVLHYQTVVDLASRRPVGAEALMRWYHPDRGVVAPEQFITIAEEKGYIEAMGTWALHEAARQGARWQALAPPGGTVEVAVNISPWQVVPGLVDLVTQALEVSGLPPQALVLEVTEHVLLERTAESAAVLGRLKELGVRLAVDDFGTGYSSLSYLSRFPVDILKIDRQFVDRLADSAEAVALTRTILNLGQALGLTTIAEGVESWRQVSILSELGCQRVQGYLFCRPLPALGVTQILELDAPGAGGGGSRAGHFSVPAPALPPGVVPLRRRPPNAAAV